MATTKRAAKPPPTVHEKIKMRRDQMGLSQSQLAERSGLWVQQISAYERAVNNPAGENLVRLAKALHVTVDWLLSADDSARKLPPLPAPEHKNKRTA